MMSPIKQDPTHGAVENRKDVPMSPISRVFWMVCVLLIGLFPLPTRAAEVSLDRDTRAAEVSLDRDTPTAEVGLDRDTRAAEVSLDRDTCAAEVGLDRNTPTAEVVSNRDIRSVEFDDHPETSFPLEWLASSTEETQALTMPPAYTEIPENLPPEISDLLPDGLFSSDPGASLTAAEQATSLPYIVGAILSAVGLRLGDAVGMLAALVGLLLMAAILSRLRDTLGGGSGEMFGFCIRLALYTAMVTQSAGLLGMVQAFFDRLGTLTAGMIPAMGVLYALGGDIGRAALNEEILMVFLTLCQSVSTTVTPPVCALCMSFSLMDALGARISLAPLAEQIKKWYTSLLGLIFFLLSLVLSAQSVLVGRADSLGMRGVKYAVGNWIPVVGGAVAGTLGTLAEGVSLLRGICGIAGVVLVALLLLPTLIELLLFRAVLRLGATTATLLDCPGEARLLGEMASLHGYLAAAVTICSVMFLLALTLLIHSGVALA